MILLAVHNSRMQQCPSSMGSTTLPLSAHRASSCNSQSAAHTNDQLAP